jgi:hypothetical protein
MCECEIPNIRLPNFEFIYRTIPICNKDGNTEYMGEIQHKKCGRRIIGAFIPYAERHKYSFDFRGRSR